MLSRRKICLILAALGALALLWAAGVAFWLALGAVAIGLAGALLPAFQPERFVRVALALGSLLAGLIALESVLWLMERSTAAALPEVAATADPLPLPPDLPPEIRAKVKVMQDAVVMPDSWRKRDLAKIPGTDPFVWHGVVHQIDANGMRRDAPIPPKDPERIRIIVVGDSLTYGEGVDVFWAYPAQLERALAPEFRVEVLNLGVRGHASGHVLDDLRRFVPELEPDLVVYGVCLNDFLERDGRQPSPPSFLPDRVSRYLAQRSRVARLVDERADALKRTLGLAPDFYADLLADFDARYQRFGEDVAAMNALVTGNGLPPMVAIVLDQYPNLNGSGHELALAAERQLEAAGMDVVESEDFYRRYDGRNFRVSRWEGHPNEEAHAIWADTLADRIRRNPALQRVPSDDRLAHGND